MAAISGLYYAVALVVDPTYRDELVERLAEQMRETFAMHADYVRLLRDRDEYAAASGLVGRPGAPPRSV